MHLTLGYLDAGSASMLLSALAGGIAGVVVAVRLWFARVRDRVLRKKPQETSIEVTQAEAFAPIYVRLAYAPS